MGKVDEVRRYKCFHLHACGITEAYHISIAILNRIEGGEEALTNRAIVQEVATWLGN